VIHVRRNHGVLDLPATGQDPGPPIVIAPGWGEGVLGWRRPALALAELTGCRVIVIASPGWSQSTTWRGRPHRKLHRRANHFLNVLRQLGVSDCVALGHSMAGNYLTEAVATNPARFIRMILLNPSGFMPDKFPALVGRLVYKVALSAVYAAPRPRLWLPTLTAYLDGGLYCLRNPFALVEGMEVAHTKAATGLKVPGLIVLSQGDVLYPPRRVGVPAVMTPKYVPGSHDPQYDAEAFSELIGELLLA
jgi:pimeloyl-ACP methyl ester carboxylesterase